MDCTAKRNVAKKTTHLQSQTAEFQNHVLDLSELTHRKPQVKPYWCRWTRSPGTTASCFDIGVSLYDSTLPIHDSKSGKGMVINDRGLCYLNGNYWSFQALDGFSGGFVRHRHSETIDRVLKEAKRSLDPCPQKSTPCRHISL